MWISRKKYNELKQAAELSPKERIKANKYDDLIRKTRDEHAVMIIDNGIICMSQEAFNEVIDAKIINESRVRALESEITWYQNEYHKLQMKTREDI